MGKGMSDYVNGRDVLKSSPRRSAILWRSVVSHSLLHVTQLWKTPMMHLLPPTS